MVKGLIEKLKSDVASATLYDVFVIVTMKNLDAVSFVMKANCRFIKYLNCSKF